MLLCRRAGLFFRLSSSWRNDACLMKLITLYEFSDQEKPWWPTGGDDVVLFVENLTA